MMKGATLVDYDAAKLANLPQLVGESNDTSGRLVKRYTVVTFDGFEVYGPAEVTFVHADTFEFSVSAAEHDHQHVEVRRLGDLIRIEWHEGFFGFRNPDQPLAFSFAGPVFNEIRIADEVTARGDTVEVDWMRIFVEKQSTLELTNLATMSLKVKLGQGSKTAISGTTDRLSVQADDESSFDGSGLNAKTAQVKARKEASVSIRAEQELEATAENSATIVYLDIPEKLKTNVEGGGSINPG
jgi:hypothetical protein